MVEVRTPQDQDIIDINNNISDINTNIGKVNDNLAKYNNKVDNKVSKDGNKVLSDNNYSNIDKSKVDKITTLETDINTRALKSELDKTNSQLEESRNYSTYTSNFKKPLVTFIDDDGDMEVITKLKPLFFSKKVPCCCAIITGDLDTGRTMKRDDLKELYKNGWEFLCHGHKYVGNLSQFTNDVDLNYQLEECKRILNQDGYTVTGIVYPQGVSDVRIRKFSKKYYNYGFANVGFSEPNKIMDTMRITRIAFGSWTANNPTVNGNSEKNTLAYYKACVDYAFDNNAWLTFMTHCGQETEGHNDIQQQYLSDIIDYIKLKGIDIVTAKEAYQNYGNKVFVGDLDNKYSILTDDGLRTESMCYRKANIDSISATIGIDKYENMTITTMDFTPMFATSNLLPDNYAGTLFTYKFTNLDAESQRNKQIIFTYNADTMYIRRALTSTTWSNWVRINYSQPEIRNWFNIKYETPNFKTSTSLFNEYEANKITIHTIYGSNTTGYPNNKSGVLWTMRIAGTGYDKQIFYENSSNNVYYRFVSADNSWSSWQSSMINTKVKYNVPEIIVPANGQIEHNIYHHGIVVANTHITGNPCWGLNNGIMYNVVISDTDKITIRLYNLTSSSITISNRDWWFAIS